MSSGSLSLQGFSRRLTNVSICTSFTQTLDMRSCDLVDSLHSGAMGRARLIHLLPTTFENRLIGRFEVERNDISTHIQILSSSSNDERKMHLDLSRDLLLFCFLLIDCQVAVSWRQEGCGAHDLLGGSCPLDSLARISF